MSADYKKTRNGQNLSKTIMELSLKWQCKRSGAVRQKILALLNYFLNFTSRYLDRHGDERLGTVGFFYGRNGHVNVSRMKDI